LTIEVSGSFDRTESFLKRIARLDVASILDRYGELGTAALRSSTPVDTGLAAQSWRHVVERSGDVYTLGWYNSDTENGFHVAIMIQYGHGTGTGGFVQGIDYINPAIRPVFDAIADDVWKVVTSA
jgi:hypothetical protein